MQMLKKNNSSTPSFMMVGNGNRDTQEKGTFSMDYTKELLNMKAPERFMFRLLMENRRPYDSNIPYIKSNLSYIHNYKFSKTEKKYLILGYKELRRKDIVVRIRRQVYIINPRLVIPQNWEIDEYEYKKAVENIENKATKEKVETEKSREYMKRL